MASLEERQANGECITDDIILRCASSGRASVNLGVETPSTMNARLPNSRLIFLTAAACWSVLNYPMSIASVPAFLARSFSFLSLLACVFCLVLCFRCFC